MKKLLLFTGVVVLAGLILSISVPGGGAGAGLTPWAEAGGTIVFESSRDGDFDIYAVNPDGTGLTQLSHNALEDSSPVPSPDGRLIAFYSRDGSRLMNSDGSGRRGLTGCSGLYSSWSPDSTRLVCEDEHEGLAIADVASGTVTPLTTSGRFPSWSPDGRTIAFIDHERLWAVPAEGGARRRVGTRKIDEAEAPSWSPDSQRIAYTGAAGVKFRQDLFTIGANGSGERRLVRGISDFQTPKWSPEGSLIAFMNELPHYVVAVYTVRSDGTGLHRVSVSRGGESSLDPTWSADGAVLLYTRARYRLSAETDIFVTSPGAREGRAVTRAFPAGGTNEAPLWMPGPRLSGGEPTPQTITLPLARRLTFADPIQGLTTDGRRAIPYLYSESHTDTSSFLVWDAIARRTLRLRGVCSSAGFALAGRRLAWTCVDRGNTFFQVELETMRLGGRRPTYVTETYEDEEGIGQTIDNLVGHGSTIAFTSYHSKGTRPSAWVLLARHASKCPRNSSDYGSHPRAVCRSLGGGVTMSVDSGRVVTVAANGLLRLRSTSGRVLRTWRLGSGIVNARLRGRTLAVQQGVSLDVYDTATGAKRQTLPLASDGGPRPFLLDVQGNFVAYATGGAIHLLRLSDGRDLALELPGGAPWLDARLEASGLFVTWNQMYARRPGRMVFVPLHAVIQGLDRNHQSVRRPFASSALSFARAKSYGAGSLPESVAIGDLNGDGKPDLVTANELAKNVSVLLNRGDGRFHVKVNYRTAVLPSSVAIGDLNGDGKPDLATANGVGSVSVLANSGDGTFPRHVEYAGGGGSIAIGDLNGDGKPDLATANGGEDAVNLLFNRGDGSFRASLNYRTGNGPVSVAIGDLNGDGRPDLATANGDDDTVSLLFNNGDSTFKAKRDYGVGLGPSSIAIGDLNGDGKADLVAANGDSSTVSVFLDGGEGNFRLGRDYGSGAAPLSVAIGDLNGDGKPDLVTANVYRTNTASVLVNRGDGSFQRRLDYGAGRRPSSVAIGDLNGDSRPDLATANLSNTVSVLINTPGLCTVQNVKGQRLPAAKQTLARANCRVGKIRLAYSKRVKTARVISERPNPGAVLRGGDKVALVVSRGRKH